MKYAFTLTAVSLLSSHIAYANPSHEANIEVKSNLFAQLGYYHQSRDQQFAIPGILTSADAAHQEQGVQLMHGELGLLAIWPQVLAGKIILGSHHGENVEVEELWLQPHLEQNWTLRLGRQLSPIGLYNDVHEHDWRFVDASLPQQAFLANQYQDDSIKLTYANGMHDLTAWVGRGNGYPAQADASESTPAALGLSYQWQGFKQAHSWRVVGSLAHFDATQRGAQTNQGHSHTTTSSAIVFDGTTTLVALGAQWQWQQFGIEAQWMGQQIDAHLSDSQQMQTDLDAFQYGVSSQIVWQREALELALRYDALISDNQVSRESSEFSQSLNADGLRPQRLSAVLNWHFAPAQTLRLQGNYEEITHLSQNAFWLVYQGNLNW
ncbi:hypothetical protein NK428_002980 [Vibrio navarrensis]|nr:hypothetical protein [Vibrio navarrensis]